MSDPPPNKRARRDNQETTGSFHIDFHFLVESGIIFCIVEFLDPVKAALINKAFLEAATKVSTCMLTKIERKHSTILQPQWKLHLSRFILSNYEQFYFSNSNNSSPLVPFPTLHPRLLLQAAYSRPLDHRVVPCRIGPSTALPNGNLVMACEDQTIRILDTQHMTWMDCTTQPSLDPRCLPFPPVEQMAERLAELHRGDHPGVDAIAGQLRDGGIPVLGLLHRNHAPFGWITDRLSYSGGHLVLVHRPVVGLFVRRSWLHVWKLEGQGQDMRARHLYTMDLVGDCSPAEQGVTELPPTQVGNSVVSSSAKDMVVARDGVFYVIRESKENGVSYFIQSFDVGTGNCVATTTIVMPQGPPGGKQPKYTTVKLFLSDNYLWFSRNVEEDGPFPGIGLGLYSFDRTNLSQQKCFLPCFEEGEIWVNMPRVVGNNKWILTRRWTEDFYRKVRINEEGVLIEEGPIKFGGRDEVKFASGNRVFVEHPDEEGDIRLDEYDVVMGEKSRTLSTGVPRQDHMVASVQSNGSAIFCMISAIGPSTNHVIQTFLV